MHPFKCARGVVVVALIVGDTPGEFTAFFRSEIAKWGRAVKASGAKPE